MKFLVETHVLEELMDMFMKSNKDHNISFLFSSSTSTTTSLKKEENVNPNNIVFILEIITLLICGCITKGIKELHEFAPTSLYISNDLIDQLPLLPHTVEQIFLDFTNYIKIFLPMQQYSENILEITKHLCWGDQLNSKSFIGNIIQSLCNRMSFSILVDQTLRVLSFVVRLEDVYQDYRIEQIFAEHPTKFVSYTRTEDFISSIQKFKDYNDKSYPISCIKWITDLSMNCPPLANYIKKNIEVFILFI